MAKIWNNKNSTYYDKGRKAYRAGDVMPQTMDKATLDEHISIGNIVDEDVKPEKPAITLDAAKRDLLFQQAEQAGLKPHYKAGIDKLKQMLDDHGAMVVLKADAKKLGIEASEDLSFEDLQKLVDEKKAGTE